MSELYNSIMFSLPEDRRKHLYFILKLLGFKSDEFKSKFIEALYKKFDNAENIYILLRNELSFKKNYVDYNEHYVQTLYDAKILSYIKEDKDIRVVIAC